MAVEGTRMRFTTERYERMVSAGILTPDDKVELIRGEIVEMSAISPEHEAIVGRIARSLDRAIGDRAVIRTRGPIRLLPDSEPEPDISVARPPDDRYLHQHPGPHDLFVVVEVAHTSLRRDRRVKIPLYAQHGIPEAWLVDLDALRVEVHTEPGPDAYRHVEVLSSGDVAPAAFGDTPLEIDDILRGLT